MSAISPNWPGFAPPRWPGIAPPLTTAATKETEQLHERRLLAAKREQEFNDYCAKRSAAE
jgi:hypothetical protein